MQLLHGRNYLAKHVTKESRLQMIRITLSLETQRASTYLKPSPYAKYAWSHNVQIIYMATAIFSRVAAGKT